MRRLAYAVVAACLYVEAAAWSAEPRVLRLATVAPAGTAWARELNAFAREVETETDRLVRVKWYFGAIAGDEMQMGERIRRDQLDGAASGGPLCEKWAPSLRVLRVLGLVSGHRETAYLMGRIRNITDEEFHGNGITQLGSSPIGPHILFSRTPVRTMAELKHGRYWVWDKDDVMRVELQEFGVPIVPLPLDAAGKAYEEGRIDGFAAPPSVALAFQWSAQARYVTDLRMDMISGCVILTNRAFDPLPLTAQSALRAAAAKLGVRFEDLGAAQDEALLGGLFARQGVKTIPVSATFSAEFFALAQQVRERLGARLVPPALLQRVLSHLADYRAEHR